jgi:hypothetical protein
MKPIIIDYQFCLRGGPQDQYRVVLDSQRMESISQKDVDPSIDEAPEWTRLDFNQCDNCPLDTASTPHCPAAMNMVELVKRFARLLSYDEITVIVNTNERQIYKDTTIQRGVCSLMGLLMATSGCPMMTFFKPMARFHLPFASTEETIWRATSSYLLAQYYLWQDHKDADITFEGLSRIYNEIQTVNISFARRLRAACQHDSMVNAIILLDMFAQSMPTAIDESLNEIRHMFAPFLTRRSEANT